MQNSFTNVYTSFPTIQTRISKMAAAQPGVVGYSGSGARFQSLDDFEKEQYELQAQIDQGNSNAQLTESRSGSPATKKTKKTPDVSAILIESRALMEMGDINWIGRLLEYHQGKGINPGPVYTEIRISEQRFACSVTIKENLEPISSLASFSRKKDAKQFISKLAIDWLISKSLMPSTGAVKFPKAPIAPQTPEPKKARAPTSPQAAATSPTTSPRERSTSPTSYPGLIPDLCHTLGFNIPTYKIVPMVEGIPIYQGYADFGSDPRIFGKVGEFRDIHGRKRAKEVCAKVVWSFLKDIERQRLESIADADADTDVEKKRKREETPLSQNSNGEIGIIAGI
ncbi:hypothetical protein EYC80_002559 [Monilinia laxa]|uniref:DRBM domain-containing protein n=1 Tax=Monilinia laxa TaxID=61186 RepID=A0A5N6K4C0_MONLA|nr:hypothetical protein EYC80_002559 [Monilinia laxa]